MKSSGLIQVVILLLLIALAASCEVGKEYANRVFKPTLPQKKVDTAALKFMQFDSDNGVDSIDLKDFAGKEMTDIDKPVLPKDSSKTEVIVAETKKPPLEQPVDASRKGVRSKRIRQ